MKIGVLTGEATVTILLLLASALVAAYWIFYRVESRSAAHLTFGQLWLLRALRMAAGLASLMALARPAVTLVHTQERLPVVGVLVDDSQSMAFPEARDNPLIRESSRDERTRHHAAQKAVDLLQAPLSRTHQVKVYTFSDAAKLLKAVPHRLDEEAPLSHDELWGDARAPEGGYSNVGDGVLEVMRDLSANRISGLVVLSDFRQTGGADLAAVAEQARNVKVPLHAVALGSPYPLRDLRIDEVVAGADASLGDVLTFHVKITNQIEPNLQPKLTLYENGQVVATRTLNLPRGQSTVPIATVPEIEGTRTFKIELPTFPDEVDPDNNVVIVHVQVVKRTIRVLLVTGEATQEYLYLVPALLRDPIVELSTWLQAADVDYVQQGNRFLDRLPQTVEDWSKFDVCMLYDVDPNGISSQQISYLEAMVNKGGGLMVIAGRRQGMGKLLQVHAAKLRQMLPIDIEKSEVPDWDHVWDKPFRVERTAIGKSHKILMASSDEQFNEELWAQFPEMYWHHSVLSLKPKAISLLEKSGDSDRGNILMALTRYGEGSVFYSGLNELWRWRDPYESYDYDRFWTRVIRYLGETKLMNKQQQVALGTDRRQYAPGEDVELSLRVLDFALWQQLQGQPVYVKVTSPKRDETMVRMQPSSTGAPVYKGTYKARQLGSMLAEARQTAPGGDTSEKPLFEVKHGFEVKLQSLEHADTSADLDGARAIAEATGGKYFDYRTMKDLASLMEAIPAAPQVLTEKKQHEVWDGWAFLAVFMSLLSAEWSLRKWWGLL